MISPTCQYAIRALVFLGRAKNDSPVLARDIAEAEEIPHPFLSKILQTLAQHGLVRSQKGPGGGFTLGRPAGQITTRDIITAIDGVPRPDKLCLLGRSECNSMVACSLHDSWSKIRARFDETIGAQTIRELAAHKSSEQPE